MEKKLDLDKVEYMWMWKDDDRKSNIIFYGLKDDPVSVEEDYITRKTPDLTKLMEEKGVKFYTCDDDHEDKRYGYFYPEKHLMFNPVDQMEGDGHCHTFYESEGKYKQL